MTPSRSAPPDPRRHRVRLPHRPRARLAHRLRRSDERARPSAVAVDDAREELALRAKRTVDGRLAFELPHVRPMMDDRDLEVETIAGGDRTAKLRLVDTQEVHERASGVEGLAGVREDPAELRQRLEDEDAGHDRASRKVAEEPRLVHRDALV